MPAARSRAPALRVVPATPSRWPHVERLFGERGACGGCWCMVWRLRNKDWVARKGSRNRAAFRRLVQDGRKPGVIAYRGREPVGWCAVAPREDYVFLGNSRVLAPVDEQHVWSVSCLFVARPHRRQGLSVLLLRGAVELARSAGARIVEGYPVESTMARTPDPFVWTGVPSAFERAGFREVARRSKTRPILRRVLRDGTSAAARRRR